MRMPQKRFIPTLTIIAGFILVNGGLSLIGSYINTVVQSAGQADSSLIFWHISIFILGLMLSAAGVFFIVIGYSANQTGSL